MISVLLEEGFYSRKQVLPLPRSHIVDERSCSEVGGRVLGCVEQRKHICEDYHFQRNSFRRHLGCVGTEMCGTLLDPCSSSGFPPFLVYGRGVLPCPLESAGAVNFDFGQWFARVVFPCDFLDAYFRPEEILPSVVLPHKLLEGGSEV